MAELMSPEDAAKQIALEKDLREVLEKHQAAGLTVGTQLQALLHVFGFGLMYYFRGDRARAEARMQEILPDVMTRAEQSYEQAERSVH